jgi:hypothetical protein
MWMILIGLILISIATKTILTALRVCSTAEPATLSRDRERKRRKK